LTALINSFTRFGKGCVLKDKEVETVMKVLNSTWNWRLGFPSVGFWADNGKEFLNKELNEYAAKFGFSVKFGPNYSPWSNGINERNHASMNITIKKMMEADKVIELKKAVEMEAWAHNTNVNILGYNPMSLVTAKSVVFLGVLTGNVATESQFDSESVKKIMKNHHRVTKEF
jgi:transposase InsO family protein